jgi:caffeoyl-CoA O-methyltransferase
MEHTIVGAEVAAYLETLLPGRPPVVGEMERQAHAQHFPMVGPLVGRMLGALTRMIGARRILELGSGFGYSAAWFADAAGQGSEVILTEGSPGRVALARDYLGRLGLADRCRFETGDALATLEREGGPFDLVFCDIDKKDYPRVPVLALPKLRQGGLLVFDNTLWYGRVAESETTDRDTRAVQALNRDLATRNDVVTFIVPLRDGVSVSVKL